MDANKLKVLQENNYELTKCCRHCEFGNFTYGLNFGTCKIKTYKHLKHTKEERYLSIFRYGVCRDFKLDIDYERDRFFIKLEGSHNGIGADC